MQSTAKSWGGRREGAGRKNRSGTVNHMVRPHVNSNWPMHVTIKVRPEIINLRRAEFLTEFAHAVDAAKKFGLVVNHFSILGNHLHLIVEACDKETLARGIQSLKIRLAKAIKRMMRESGRKVGRVIFKGRYHLHVLNTAFKVRNAIRYVLINEFRHKKKDPGYTVFSSGGVFTQWSELDLRYSGKDRIRHAEYWRKIKPLGEFLTPFQSWLGSYGWTMT